MIGLALRLLGIGRWLKEAAGAAFALARRYPWQAAVIALCAAVIALCGASLWLWHGKSVEHRHWVDEIAGRLADRHAYEQASAANLAAQIEQRRAWEAKSTEAAKDNQIHEQDLRREYGSRSIAYADRMRADKVCRRIAPSPAQDNPAPIPDSAGQDAVVVSRPDYDTLVENTIRLKAAHDWAESLVRDGQAVALPEVEFGK